MAKITKRDEELSTRKAVSKRLLEVFADVEKGFGEQRTRADEILDFWDAYNCQLGERQFYNGTSQIFVPIVHDAIEARVTRFTNQIFPQSGRYVDVTTSEGDLPNATMALLENYVRSAHLRTQVVPALIRNGDNEGQYSLYVDWRKTTRHVAQRVKEPVRVGGLDMPDLGEVDTIEEMEVVDAGPSVEVIADADLLVLPVTANSIDEAIEEGGSVTVMRRWSKSRIKRMIADGDIETVAGEALLANMSRKESPNRPDTAKALAHAAGIRGGAGVKFAQVFETWTKLKIDGKMRVCRAYYGGDEQIIGCKLNPYWCDRVPVISAPVRKLPNVFKGRPPAADVLDLQILANDTINEGADTAHFSAMPIIATDPEKNPRVGSMVLGLAALWETSPNDTKFMQFPELWRSSLERAEAIKTQVFQTLGVNPSMMPQQTGTGRKRNQAEIALEQQVDVLTTADSVTNIEEGVLTPLTQRFADYDHQFREDSIAIRVYGEMGLRAKMEEVDPIQMNKRYVFTWLGVEAARNAARMQQQIAGINVVKGIPPQMYAGYKLNLAPVMVQLMENLFGPRLAPLVLEDQRMQLSVEPEMENQMLEQGFQVAVHPGDDDVKHLQAHVALMQQGDPHGNIRLHLQAHQVQMQAKTQMAQQQQQAGLGGGGGGPQPGAQPGTVRGAKGPPGAIGPEQMPAAGAVDMPRKM